MGVGFHGARSTQPTILLGRKEETERRFAFPTNYAHLE